MSSAVIRADASTTIGSGHIMRCLTLADSLRARGVAISFVCRTHPGHLCDLIEARGFDVRRLPISSRIARDVRGYEPWLGDRWEDDARDTRDIVASLEGPSVIVDHYGADHRWHSAVRDAAKNVMVIDDLADRVLDCDLLLDQNLVDDMDNRYAGKTPATCERLFGPSYALLAPEYAERHDRTAPRIGKPRRVLVYFGGGDDGGMTHRALRALMQLDSTLAVDAVVSRSNPSYEIILQLAAQHPAVTVHSGLASLAPLLETVDAAIGACGATTWERICLGVPTIGVTVADNQRPIALELDRRGLLRWIGDVGQVTDTELSSAITQLLDDDSGGRAIGAARDLVDGRGVDRVAAAFICQALSVRARPADAGDEDLLLQWANDPGTRRNAFQSERISAASHSAWFTAKLTSAKSHMLIVEESGVPVGQTRFDRAGDRWRISYSVAPEHRGRGLGRLVLESALLTLRRRVPDAAVFAEVKPENAPSRRVFESMRFLELRHPDILEYRRGA